MPFNKPVKVIASVPGKVIISGTDPIEVDSNDSYNPVISIKPASTTEGGVVRLATEAEVVSGTDDTTALTPLGAASVYLIKDISQLDPLI